MSKICGVYKITSPSGKFQVIRKQINGLPTRTGYQWEFVPKEAVK